MNEIDFFQHMVTLYFFTRRNKRRGKDSMAYEIDWVANLVKDTYERLSRETRIEKNYAFLVSVPRWREIIATEFKGRMVDTEICEIVQPCAEEVLSEWTFNNRKGKGCLSAIEAVEEKVIKVTNGYRNGARIIKLDFKGYFPNALWDYAESVIDRIIDNANIEQEQKAYLKWLTMISIQCNPANHFEYRTPKFMWEEHIEKEKSILFKPTGVGAAIGRLIWQTAMGLYINDELKWLTGDCGLDVVCFVDDIVMVSPERLHGYALSLIPELEKRLARKNVRLNKKKFYDQPYQHGLEFLGYHIKPFRRHLNNKTYARALKKIKELNKFKDKFSKVALCLQTVNSYIGLMKRCADHNRTLKLVSALDREWLKYISYNVRRGIMVYNEGYRDNDRLDILYNIKPRRNEKRRTNKALKRAVHNH